MKIDLQMKCEHSFILTKSQIRMIHNSFVECEDKFDADSKDIINGKIK